MTLHPTHTQTAVIQLHTYVYLFLLTGGSDSKEPPAMWETCNVQSQGWKDPLEKEMATHSSILAWKIPMDGGAWGAAVHGGCKESDMTERLNTARTLFQIFFHHRLLQVTVYSSLCYTIA